MGSEDIRIGFKKIVGLPLVCFRHFYAHELHQFFDIIPNIILLSQDVFFSTNLDKVSPIDTTISTNT
jgi:hypothetical protein